MLSIPSKCALSCKLFLKVRVTTLISARHAINFIKYFVKYIADKKY